MAGGWDGLWPRCRGQQRSVCSAGSRARPACQEADAVMRCPRGHAMTARVARELWTRWYRATCKECHKHISVKDAGYHCKECSRSICVNCAADRQGAWCSVRADQDLDRTARSQRTCGSKIMAGDVFLCGPDRWGIHHVVMCCGPLTPVEADIAEAILGYHPDAAAGDMFGCETIESTRGSRGLEFPWYPALSIFVRQGETGELRLVGDMGKDTDIVGVHQVPVPVKLLLHPLRPQLAGLAFDSRLFESATRLCARQSRRWGKATAIKALVSGTRAIDPADMADPKSRLDLMKELRRRWTTKPICASVVIQVWQKYLEMSFSASPEATDLAVQQILRWMPVFCDQTAPSALVQVLSTRGWLLLGRLNSDLITATM